MSAPLPPQTPPPIRDACSLILWRQTTQGPAVLMGQRGAKAQFMPNKFVFPGGGLDPQDTSSPQNSGLSPRCHRRLGALADALISCGLRELQEETGLTLRQGAGLHFIFRAITPRQRPRRFDARFLMADARDLANPDAPLPNDGELRHLTWVPLHEARALDLPFVTELVLAEAGALLAAAHRLQDMAPAEGVPFFDNRGPRPVFSRIC
ncbi:NUDIX hydrolase [Thioclava sp. GXIMD4216]|uniref:NUDIX hydrolase n=1 Tax=Thioclava litoralis TaxID=3076557 RepID=A0ABZ1E0I7_9RHOB|nr:NUDIX hydrolase [Thioclava sp. FTW29]